MKCIYYIISFIISIVFLSCCSDGNVTKLKTQIHLADIDCPINMGIAGDLVSIKYNEKDNNVILYFSINEEYAGPSLFKNNKDRLIKQFKLSLANEESRQLITDIVNARASITAVYKSNSTGKARTISLSYEDLKDLKDSYLSEREINQMRLETIVDNQNSVCPIKEDEGIVRTKVALVNDNVVIYYEMDENLYDIKSLKKNKDELLKVMMNDLQSFRKDPTVLREYNLLISLGIGYQYRYYGNQTKDYLDIIITPNDMQEALYN